MADWDKRFLQLSREISTWSKDPSTQVGAVIINEKRRILATGYNGFPRGIYDKQSRLQNRERKYQLVVHAEMNLIYNATYNGVSLDGSTLYVWGLPICSECAKGVIQVGISRVVMPDHDFPKKWKSSWEISRVLFNEAGIKYDFVDMWSKSIE